MKSEAMRAIGNRVLAALGAGSLAAKGLAACGYASTAGAWYTMADAVATGTVAADGTAVDAANGEAKSTVTEGASTDGVGNTPDSTDISEGAALGEAAVDSGTEGGGSCACSMVYGPCGAANPCGCCAVTGVFCSGSSNVCIIQVP